MRGWKKVQWYKSIALGWSFFIAGCLLNQTLSLWLTNGTDAQNFQVGQCYTTQAVFGIAVGWILPVIFHFTGSICRSHWELKKVRVN